MIFALAEKKQLERIYEIASYYDLKNNNKDDRGFLVSSYSLEQYETFFEDPNKVIYVALENDIVQGFIYGYQVPFGDKSNTLAKIMEVSTESDFVVKQICVASDSEKGTGSFLMEKLFKLVEGDIYLAIVSNPLNISSLLFHKKLGFIECNRVMEKDNLERLIMVRYNNQELDSYKDIALRQYEVAVDLYKHEDQLTWTKFNFSIITNGAILSIMIPNINDEFNSTLFGFIVAVIVCINIGYIYTISMGRIYLSERKKDAVMFEDKLKYLGMSELIKPHSKDVKINKILNSSFTKYVQYLIPITFTIGWIIIMFLNLR